VEAAANPRRLLNGLSWAVPLLAVVLATPWDFGFYINFPALALPTFVVLGLLTFLELRQPEFAATAGALAAYPLVCFGIATITHGWSWIVEFFFLPGFFAGALLTVRVSRRSSSSAKLVALGVGAPLLGVVAEYLLLAFVTRI
jgi:hypothetical protein